MTGGEAAAVHAGAVGVRVDGVVVRDAGIVAHVDFVRVGLGGARVGVRHSGCAAHLEFIRCGQKKEWRARGDTPLKMGDGAAAAGLGRK